MLHARITVDSEVEPRRREPRTDVEAEVALRPLGRTSVEARLVNLSSRGFMVETRAVVEPGARIWLTLPAAGRVNALVLWARNGRLGGEFAEAIDPLAVIEAVGRP
jgi:hypothetical protein